MKKKLETTKHPLQKPLKTYKNLLLLTHKYYHYVSFS